jgi:hypothetical protein
MDGASTSTLSANVILIGSAEADKQAKTKDTANKKAASLQTFKWSLFNKR